MKALGRTLHEMNRTTWIAACASMAVVALAYGQPPANPPAGGPPGTQRRPRNNDPAKMFDAASNGRDVIYRSSLNDRQRMFFDQIMGSRGGANSSSNSFISRNDFMNALSAVRPQPGRAGPSNISSRSWQYGATFQPQSTQSTPSANSDRGNWSAQNSRRSTRMAGVDQFLALSSLAAPTHQPDAARPIMLRADNLPANEFTMFSRLDTDHDGQIGLYEWVSAGLAPSDFKLIDRNDDGLITPAELETQVRGGAFVPESNGLVLAADNRAGSPNAIAVNQPAVNGTVTFTSTNPMREPDMRGRPRGRNRRDSGWSR